MNGTSRLRDLLAAKKKAQAALDAYSGPMGDEHDMLVEASCAADREHDGALFYAETSLLDRIDALEDFVAAVKCSQECDLETGADRVDEALRALESP